MLRLALFGMLLFGRLGAAGLVLLDSTFYDGPKHSDDRCTGMVVAGDGTVFLTGYSMGIDTDFDFATLRIDTAGEVVWVQRFGSPLGSEDRPWCFAPSPAGVVAAGGSIADTVQSWDAMLLSYRSDGSLAWQRRLDFGTGADEKSAGLAVGPDGRVTVTGRVEQLPDSTGRRGWDVFLVRLDAAGETLWTRRYDGPAGGDDWGTGVVLGSSGDCYVAGRAARAETGGDIAVLKYDSTGGLSWRSFFSGTGRHDDLPVGILSADRPTVFGAVHGGATSYDMLVARLGPDGRTVWQRVLDGARGVDIPTGAVLMPDGGLVVTGHSFARGTGTDVLTVRFSAGGETLWTRRWAGLIGTDRGWCLAQDRHGIIVVGGTAESTRGFGELVLLVYSPAGELLSTAGYSAGGPGECRPIVMAFDPRPGHEDELLVAGYASRPGSGYDFALLRFALATGDSRTGPGD